MKNTENNKKLYRRYLDDLYTTEDARATTEQPARPG